MVNRIIFSIIMSFSFISNALAQGTPGGHPQETNWMSILPMLAIFVLVFYFLLIRPQNKRAKEQRKLLEGLTRGDEVVTNGGLMGTIKKVADNYVEMEITENINIKMQKAAVTTILPKGTIKSV